MKPRMLLTLDTEGSLLSVPVRLGQAVDVVAQAGRPKAITGALLGFRLKSSPLTSLLVGLGLVLEPAWSLTALCNQLCGLVMMVQLARHFGACRVDNATI
jgi:hypothetical protein